MSEGRTGAPGRERPAVLLWCDTTARQSYETGIQRVTRRLGAGLEATGIAVTAVGWDPVRHLMTALGPGATLDIADRWLLVPEIPLSTLQHDIDPVQIGRALGLPTAAVVHDLIPLKRAHDYDAGTVALYRRYFQMFAAADIVFATTELIAAELRGHLGREGLRVPPIAVVALPAQFARTARVRTPPPHRAADEPLRLLAVSSWEPRKNQQRLLGALGAARSRSSVPIALTLVGRRGLFPEYDCAVLALLGGMPDVTVTTRASDDTVAALYAAHHASVYPSIEEGFGLPVVESLWLGRPCLCHAGSAMAEVAPGGGTAMIDMEDEAVIAEALTALATDPARLAELAAEAVERPLRNWTAYAVEVAGRLGREADGRA